MPDETGPLPGDDRRDGRTRAAAIAARAATVATRVATGLGARLRAADGSPAPGVVGALVGLAALAQPVARGFATDPAAVSGDPAFFFASGWASAHGEVVYLSTWDVKPPGVHLLTWAAAAVAGSATTYHALVVAVVAAATLAAFALADGVLRAAGAGPVGRAAGAVALLAYPSLYRLPAAGAYTKVFVLAFALATLLALRHGRPLATGACAAAAAAFWQAGAVVAVVALVATARRDGLRAAARVVAGGGAVAALVVAPVALAGAWWAMVLQVVVAPLLAGGRVAVAVPSELYGLPAAVLGAALAGLAVLAVRGDRGERAYVAVAAGFLVVALAGQASTFDRVLYAGVLAVPVGVAVGRLPRRAALVALAALVVQVAVVAPALSGAVVGGGVTDGPAADDPGSSRLVDAVLAGRDTSCHVYRSLYARALETRYQRLVRRGDDCAAPTGGAVLAVFADVLTGSVPEPDAGWGGGPAPQPAVDPRPSPDR